MTNSHELQATLQNIYGEAAEAMSELLDTRNMYIALYDEATTMVEFPLAYQNGELVPDEKKRPKTPFGPRQFGERSGLTEWVIRNKRPLLIPKDFEGRAKAEGIKVFNMNTKCWLGAPMTLGNRVIGVIGLQNFEEENVFDDNHQKLLETIARQAAVAIENARLFETTRQTAREREARLQLLQQISKRMAEASQNPDGVLEFVARAANDIIHSDLTSLYLYDQKTATFTGGVSVGRDRQVEAVETQVLPQPDDFAGEIAENQGSRFIGETEEQPEISSFARRNQMRAFATLPLTIADMQGMPVTVGVLFVNFKNPHTFPEDEQEILGHLANQAAVAIAYTSAQSSALAQEQLAALGTAAGTLQHRLGNTINVILPAVLRLRRRLNDDPTSEEILNTIERNALFATEVIRRMQTPLQREEFARTNLNSLLREAIQKCIQEDRYPGVSVLVNPTQQSDYSPPQPHIMITTELDDEMPETYASVGQMTEVFRVLVENAIKAIHPEPGFVTVTSKLAPDRLGRFVEITVNDTGKGIDEKTRAKLFRQPVPRQEFGEGAGLGLWLSHIIVRSHRGAIRLQASEPDQGSTFWVRLPILTQPPFSYSTHRGEAGL